MVALKWPISPNRSVLFAANAIFLEIVYANRMGPIYIKRRDSSIQIKKKFSIKIKSNFFLYHSIYRIFVLQSIYFFFSGNFKWKFSPCMVIEFSIVSNFLNRTIIFICTTDFGLHLFICVNIWDFFILQILSKEGLNAGLLISATQKYYLFTHKYFSWKKLWNIKYVLWPNIFLIASYIDE